MGETPVVHPWREGRPRAGQTFAVVFPHSDDFSIFTGGLIEKLLYEGARGYFIRVTNDEMDSFDLSVGETVCRIERETRRAADFWGIEKLYDFNYKNHYLQHGLLLELRHRLITLFRFLKIDIAISFDPWGLYEENPDHTITGMAVEQACWMAGRRHDLEELTDMGLAPRFVTEKYYFARGIQHSNAVIDTSRVCEKKVEAVLLHETPVDNMWKEHLEAHGGNALYRGKEEFVRTELLSCPEPMMGLPQYEKYRYIGNGGNL